MIELFVKYCIQHRIIDIDDIPILRYCIEKKFYSLIVSIPLCIVGIWLSDLLTTLSFLGTFYFLRSTTNGYHAENVGICFVSSLFVECFLFICSEPFLSHTMIIVITMLCVAIIWWLAPYNHPNMDLCMDEIYACRASSRKRITILVVFLIVSSILSEERIINGLTLGIVLTAGLLSIAYIKEWRNKYVQFQRKQSRKNHSCCCPENDSAGNL